jgi:glycerophosphoryl diester phosphodiesterase
MGKNKYCWISILLFCCVVCVLYFVENRLDTFLINTEPDKNIIVVGHRGASKYAPENTIASFKKALESGANGIECDVIFTHDDIPVIAHDRNLSYLVPLEQRPAIISDMDIIQVKKLDVGSCFSKKYEGEKIPTLREALSFLSGRVDRIYLHDKSQNDYTGLKKERILIFAAEIRTSNMKDKIIVMVESGDLSLWQKLAPDIQLLQCWISFGDQRYKYGRIQLKDSFNAGIRHMGVFDNVLAPSPLGSMLNNLGLKRLAQYLSFLQIKKTVRQYKIKNCDFTVFILNDRSRLALYLDAGFKAIGTDDPGLLISILKTRR